ncbi:MAG: Hsp20/alpha crystallin family protein [Dehalococcoidia bacterium]|nr:Hsp20/alpha crystallin family protein [Dehalococcoidia bacterium]
MYRRGDRLTLAAALPGAEPEDIEIQITADGRLALRGRVRGQSENEDEILLDEWSSGPYERELELPVPVDAGLANVTYNNGVLVIVLPIAEKVRPGRLHMDRVGSAHGERIGSHGRVAQPITSEEHHHGLDPSQ